MSRVFVWRSSDCSLPGGGIPAARRACLYCNHNLDVTEEGELLKKYDVVFLQDFINEYGPELFQLPGQAPAVAECPRCGWWEKLARFNMGSARESEAVMRDFCLNDHELTLPELRSHLAKRYKDVYELSPRRFEEVVGDVYSQIGYTVVLTPQSRDGGVDLICLQNSHDEPLIVECKRYRDDRSVGIYAVDRLLGVQFRTGARAAHLVTSSAFTRQAKQAATEAADKGIELHLVDAHELLRLLAAYADPKITITELTERFEL